MTADDMGRAAIGNPEGKKVRLRPGEALFDHLGLWDSDTFAAYPDKILGKLVGIICIAPKGS